MQPFVGSVPFRSRSPTSTSANPRVKWCCCCMVHTVQCILNRTKFKYKLFSFSDITRAPACLHERLQQNQFVKCSFSGNFTNQSLGRWIQRVECDSDCCYLGGGEAATIFVTLYAHICRAPVARGSWTNPALPGFTVEGFLGGVSTWKIFIVKLLHFATLPLYLWLNIQNTSQYKAISWRRVIPWH